MREFTSAAVSMVPAQEPNIGLVVRFRTVASCAATSVSPRRIAALQHDLGEGPVSTRCADRQSVSVADLADEPRRPRFALAAPFEGMRPMKVFAGLHIASRRDR